MISLYNKYRPKRLKDVVGQDATVRVFDGWLRNNKVPSAILLAGPSGVGKTTLARILSRKLDCSRTDFIELNCANVRGIDDIRALDKRCKPKPLKQSRFTILDEAHQLTGPAQNVLLKVLEDAKSWSYFVLCTTDPGKIIKTIQTRCSIHKLNPVSDDDLEKLIKHVSHEEGFKLPSKVVERIVDCAEGSPRRALVSVEAICNLESEDQQLDAIEKTDSRRDSVEICKAMLDGRNWNEVSRILKSCDLSEPESLRHLVLNYCAAVLLNNPRKAPRAAMIIDVFRDHLFDSKLAGFILCCYQAGCVRK